jgi:two-component sensor histidine kinase
MIINELVSNALKHGFPAGRRGEVFVQLRRNDGSYVLRVKDTGVGLSRETDWEKPKTLGLRLVRTLVGQLDGTMEVRSKGGTEFVVTFPHQA